MRTIHSDQGVTRHAASGLLASLAEAMHRGLIELGGQSIAVSPTVDLALRYDQSARELSFSVQLDVPTEHEEAVLTAGSPALAAELAHPGG